ncbi:MAG: sigma-70 family RNA polymerase sigma factor [Actinomycetes bacterium]
MIAADAGDPEACRRLVDTFLPAILGVALSFSSGGGVERQELIQEGVAGLLLAAKRYNPRLDTPFWAYASFWVRKAMQELVAELARPVVLSDRAVRALAAIHTTRAQFLQTHGAEPTTDELSRATGFSRAKLESLLMANRAPRSMEQQLSTDEDIAGTVGDRIIDPTAEAAYERVLDDIEIHEVRSLADQLGERERLVIRAHYGLGEPVQTLSQIGRALGVTAERTRQIEAGALDRLRAALAQPAPAVAGPA